MTRQQKYPDTSTFHFYNANPHNKFTDDCVIRALSTAMNKTWKQVYLDLFEIGLKYGLMPTDSKCFEQYLKDNGWVKQKQPRKADNTKYTGKEWCNELFYSLHCNCIANIGGHHIVAFMEDNKFDKVYRFRVYDTWDSTDGCIGNYWVREEI